MLFHLFVKEEKKDNKEVQTITSLIISFKGFYMNKNLRFLLIFLLTWRYAFCSIISTFELKLIKLGYPKEDLAFIDSFLIVITLISCTLSGNLTKAYREMHAWKINYIILIFLSMLGFYLISFYE